MSRPIVKHALAREAGQQGQAEVAAKLRVSQPNDPLEQEADRVADEVLRMPTPNATKGGVEDPSGSLSVARTVVSRAHGQLQQQPIEEQEEEIQLAPQAGPAAAPSIGARSNLVDPVRGGGRPLSEAVRGYFEPRFGADLSGVRVHTGEAAKRATAATRARAFTVGNNIAFAPGEFNPTGSRGRRLLAHELAHVIQQSRTVPDSIQRKPIPIEPEATPFIGKILPWSAALHTAPARNSKVLADLPRDSRVKVLEGRAWILVEAIVGDKTLQGYVSHELIEATDEPLPDKEQKPQAENEPEEESSNEDKEEKKDEEEVQEPDHFSYDPRLNPELKERFNRMVGELKKRKIGFGGLTGMRSAKDAHLFSTAYHIYEGLVPLSSLQSLPDGKDIDLNVWYKKEWETYSPAMGFDRAATEAEIMERAKDHALNASPRTQIKENWGFSIVGLTFAEEGYESDDPKRAPNLKSVPVSVHTTGNAIDLQGIQWSEFGGAWSDEAIAFVASFGLWRPFNSETAGSPDNPRGAVEDWHFELAPTEAKPEAE